VLVQKRTVSAANHPYFVLWIVGEEVQLLTCFDGEDCRGWIGDDGSEGAVVVEEEETAVGGGVGW